MMKTRSYDGAMSIESSSFGLLRDSNGLHITFIVDIKTRDSLIINIFESYCHLLFDTFNKLNLKNTEPEREENGGLNRINKKRIMKYINME